MTSQINTSSIDDSYPVPGRAQSTQGFRTNFANIKTALNIAKSEISNAQTKYIRIGIASNEDVEYSQSTILDAGIATGQGGTADDGSSGYISLPITLKRYLTLGSNNSFDTSSQNIQFTVNSKGIITALSASPRGNNIQTFTDVSSSAGDGSSIRGVATATNLSFKRIGVTLPLTVTSNDNSVIIGLPQALGLLDGAIAPSSGFGILNSTPLANRNLQFRNLAAASGNRILLSYNNTSDMLYLDVDETKINIANTTGSLPATRITGLQQQQNALKFKDLTDSPSGNYPANTIIATNSNANGTSYLPAPSTSSTYLQWNGTAFVWAAATGEANVLDDSNVSGGVSIIQTPAKSGIRLMVKKVQSGSTKLSLTDTSNQMLTFDIVEANLNLSNMGGVLPATKGGTGLFAAPSTANTYLTFDGSNIVWGNAVTSINMSVPSIMAVSGGPITSSGTFGLTLNPQASNKMLAGPISGTDSLPTFRALDPSDIPEISAAKITSGLISVGVLGTGQPDSTTVLTGANTWVRAGTGTVTSVDMTVPLGFTISNNPITVSGTFAIDLATQSINKFLASPVSGADDKPVFRAINPADIPVINVSSVPNLDASKIASGTFDSARIGNVDGSAITSGTIPAARISGLNASVITAGYVDVARLGASSSSTKFLRGDNTWVEAGVGTVTSVGLNMPSQFSVTNSPVTSSDTLSVFWNKQGFGKVFIGPSSGADDYPTFRVLTITDINDATTLNGTIKTSLLGTGTLDGTRFLRDDGTWALTVPTYPVKNANKFFAGPSSGADAVPDFRLITVNDINVIASGTIKTTILGTGTSDGTKFLRDDGAWIVPPGSGGPPAYGNQNPNKVLAGPGSGATDAVAVFRLLVAADVPVLDTSKITTGTMAVARLGTGTASATTVLRGDGSWVSTDQTFPTETANTIFAGPSSGSAAAPAFRSLAIADIPNLAASIITSGTFDTARIPNLDASKITTGIFDMAKIPNLAASIITSGTFDTARIPGLDGSKIISGTVGTTYLGTGTASSSNFLRGDQTWAQIVPSFPAQNANKVYSGPTSGSDAVPTFRSLVAADVPSHDASLVTSGTIGTARLGSGSATATSVLRGDQTWSDALSPMGSQTANTFLCGPNGSAGTPAFRAIVNGDLPNIDATKVTTGTFNINRIGTGNPSVNVFLRGDNTWATPSLQGSAPFYYTQTEDHNNLYIYNLTYSNLKVPSGIPGTGGSIRDIYVYPFIVDNNNFITRPSYIIINYTNGALDLTSARDPLGNSAVFTNFSVDNTGTLSMSNGKGWPCVGITVFVNYISNNRVYQFMLPMSWAL